MYCTIKINVSAVRNMITHWRYGTGAKGDWDFQISDLVKNPGGTDI